MLQHRLHEQCWFNFGQFSIFVLQGVQQQRLLRRFHRIRPLCFPIWEIVTRKLLHSRREVVLQGYRHQPQCQCSPLSASLHRPRKHGLRPSSEQSHTGTARVLNQSHVLNLTPNQLGKFWMGSVYHKDRVFAVDPVRSASAARPPSLGGIGYPAVEEYPLDSNSAGFSFGGGGEGFRGAGIRSIGEHPHASFRCSVHCSPHTTLLPPAEGVKVDYSTMNTPGGPAFRHRVWFTRGQVRKISKRLRSIPTRSLHFSVSRQPHGESIWRSHCAGLHCWNGRHAKAGVSQTTYHILNPYYTFACLYPVEASRESQVLSSSSLIRALYTVRFRHVSSKSQPQRSRS